MNIVYLALVIGVYKQYLYHKNSKLIFNMVVITMYIRHLKVHRYNQHNIKK